MRQPIRLVCLLLLILVVIFFAAPHSSKAKISNRTLFCSFGPVVITAPGLAVLVNMVELLCTAGLPAVYTQVLASHTVSKLTYYTYLAIYNIAYIVDDGLIVAIAVITMSRTRLQEAGGRILKLISGTVLWFWGYCLSFIPPGFTGPEPVSYD